MQPYHQINSPEHPLRRVIRESYLLEENVALDRLLVSADFSLEIRAAISARAEALVLSVRQQATPSIMEGFLTEYGLGSQEGLALMCLAEALLRVPDAATVHALMEDKLVPGDWQRHLGHSPSTLINTTTWGLMVVSSLLRPEPGDGMLDSLHGLLRKLGEPLVSSLAQQAMKEMGRQFVLGGDLSEALDRAESYESSGYTFSYDMLGEAALTATDADAYFQAYSTAIEELAERCQSGRVELNPGISIKLSALHPRYQFSQRERVVTELSEKVLALAQQARRAGMGFNIDAEEADRLELSLDIAANVIADPSLRDWDGFGLVIQAYSKRAPGVIDWLHHVAQTLRRRLMVRLVKGAYWDAEIKRAQTIGLDGFPVFTCKAATDVSYLCCARKLLSMKDLIYPQFATHNAHTMAAILELSDDAESFEFQRLHGMGEALHDQVITQTGCRSRVYAPVGKHSNLLAYLVRRLLENGANSSFVHQIADHRIPSSQIAADPITRCFTVDHHHSAAITWPQDLWGPERPNSRGWDLSDATTVDRLHYERQRYLRHQWQCQPVLAVPSLGSEAARYPIYNPASRYDVVGSVLDASNLDVQSALKSAAAARDHWRRWSPQQRHRCLFQFAELLQIHSAELFALLAREAGKTLPDAVAEVREAVDFARYYGAQCRDLTTDAAPLGVVVCISPWNFPLAIFCGQVLAAVAAGNVVMAKPAEQTPLIAARAVEILREAGVPEVVVQLLPGSGEGVGGTLCAASEVDGVCFTGSLQTARQINISMARDLSPSAPLIAETGGQNAMIVDSTALPEQVVRDVLSSAFQSAGQRCSSLRMLYLQEEIAEQVISMLCGAMDELQVGDPWLLASDIGPVIDEQALRSLRAYCQGFQERGQLVWQLPLSDGSCFMPPTVLRVKGIEELGEEMFGPVLHVATFGIAQLDQIINAINATGYGLTFGFHSRIDARARHVCSRVRAGNLYVNRNQIGAVVGSQPFGGNGLSGTGPKAGGPLYLRRLLRHSTPKFSDRDHSRPLQSARVLDESVVQRAIEELRQLSLLSPEVRYGELRKSFQGVPEALDAEGRDLPGPTGERNHLSFVARGLVICLGPGGLAAEQQALQALSQGNRVLVVIDTASPTLNTLKNAGLPLRVLTGRVEPRMLTTLTGFDAVVYEARDTALVEYRQALALREGAILALITDSCRIECYVTEKLVCTDITAAGGNATLIAAL